MRSIAHEVPNTHGDAVVYCYKRLIHEKRFPRALSMLSFREWRHVRVMKPDLRTELFFRISSPEYLDPNPFFRMSSSECFYRNTLS